VKNWKTNSFGIAIVAVAIVLAFAPGIADRFHQTASDALMIAAGCGLIAAKDHDK
jgi:hypothetical protein